MFNYYWKCSVKLYFNLYSPSGKKERNKQMIIKKTQFPKIYLKKNLNHRQVFRDIYGVTKKEN